MSGNGGKKFSRRKMLAGIGVGAAAFTIVPRHVLGGPGNTAPSDQIPFAAVGCGGRGGADLRSVSNCGGKAVALCDVDKSHMDKLANDKKGKYKGAKLFQDFRKMLDAVDKDIDAVTIGVPDHNHAVIAMEAIKRGKHVYCEKPLAHSIAEVRALTKAAKEHKVITQLGNQGHSSEDTRRLVEWVRAGLIGKVSEVHCACDAFRKNHLYCQINHLGQLKDKTEIPASLDWDQWIGPAAMRPYEPFYHPWNWRGWSAFGCGALGDWFCHVADPSYWALDLDAPTSVIAEVDKDYDPKKDFETFPQATKLTFEFPAKGDRGPVTLYWYDGDHAMPHPAALEENRKAPGTGAVLIGEGAGISHGSHGASGCRIFPESKMRAAQKKLPKPYLKRASGHHQEWVNAIRENRPADADFSYGGPLTEVSLVGIIGIRFAGQKLNWDSANMKFTNCDEANKLVAPEFRTGWTL